MLQLRRATLPLGHVRGRRSAAIDLTPHVSVCIANWNCQAMLHDCLHSLLRVDQATTLEVIVVDNASTDGAADMIAREFPDVRLVRNAANHGFAGANNQAAWMARGRYLFFLNNDTLVPSRTLGPMVAHLDAHPEIILLGPALREPSGRLQVSFRQRPTVAAFLHRTWIGRLTGLGRRRYQTYRRPEKHGPATVEVLMGAALLTPRQRFLEQGGWDERYTFGGEDLELCHRLASAGSIEYFPHVAITHFGSISSKENAAFAAPHIAIGFARYFRQAGASRREMLIYKTILTLDAPLQLAARLCQYVGRCLSGRRQEAEKSWSQVRGVSAFLFKHLFAFWRT